MLVRRTKPSPAAHQDASWISKVPPAGKERQGSPRAALSWQNVTTQICRTSSIPGTVWGAGLCPPVPDTEPWLQLPSAARGVQEHQPSPRNEPDPILKTEKQDSTDNS